VRCVPWCPGTDEDKKITLMELHKDKVFKLATVKAGTRQTE
jgi:hypothetical protein